MDLIEKIEAAMDERARVLEGSGILGWLTYRNADGSMRYTTAADGLLRHAIAAGSQPLDEPHWCVDGKEATGYAHAQVVHDEQQAWRQLAAHRKILELHDKPERYGDGYLYCRTCGSGEPYEYPTAWPCDTVLALAEAYGIKEER